MWFVALLIGLVINIVAYLLMPKPKQDKPAAATEMDNPTADSGRPIPTVFGTITVKSSNIIWYGEKNLREYKAGKKPKK